MHPSPHPDFSQGAQAPPLPQGEHTHAVSRPQGCAHSLTAHRRQVRLSPKDTHGKGVVEKRSWLCSGASAVLLEAGRGLRPPGCAFGPPT